MKTLYVVYRESNGALKSSVIEIDGKVNITSILKELKLIKYHEDETQECKVYLFDQIIISWQEVDEFTDEELKEFTNENNPDKDYLYWWMN